LLVSDLPPHLGASRLAPACQSLRKPPQNMTPVAKLIVKNDGPAMSALVRLYPRKPTFIVRNGMSEKCPNSGNVRFELAVRKAKIMTARCRRVGSGPATCATLLEGLIRSPISVPISLQNGHKIA
jgi:hypothetical protein